jgi:hypothetical protein
MLYLYAITQPGPVPDVAGLQGVRPRTTGEGELVAVVSEHDDLRLEGSEDELWAHEEVVESLMAQGPVLPMRFGTVVADEAAVLAALEERRADLEAALERVRGAVELGVRATLTVGSSSEPDATQREGPGTAYLLGRMRRDQDGQRAAARIHEPLSALSRASTSQVTWRERPVLKAAYLVDAGEVDVFRRRVETLEGELGEARIVCTGPWPPYSFSTEEQA